MIVKDAFGIEQIAGVARQHHYYRCEARFVFKRSRNGKRAERTATANVSHPAKQGFIQTLGVFFDTMVICSATAFMTAAQLLTPAKSLTAFKLHKQPCSITLEAGRLHLSQWRFLCSLSVQSSETTIMVETSH